MTQRYIYRRTGMVHVAAGRAGYTYCGKFFGTNQAALWLTSGDAEVTCKTCQIVAGPTISVDEARAVLMRKLDAELSLLRSKLEGWRDDIRIGPAIRADMRELLEPSADGPYIHCAIHGVAPRSHPYYHDKHIFCATCAKERDSL